MVRLRVCCDGSNTSGYEPVKEYECPSCFKLTSFYKNPGSECISCGAKICKIMGMYTDIEERKMFHLVGVL